MTNNVLCDEFAERLADLLERDVDEATRAALEAHALMCDECGALLADLRKLRIDASNLPQLAPSRDLWQGVAERIDAPVIPLRGDHPDASPARRWRRWGSLAAAAAVLVAVTSVATHYLTMRTRTDARPTVATGTEPSNPARNSGSSPAQVAAVSPTPDSSTAPNGSPQSVSSKPGTTTRFASNGNAKPSAEEIYASEIARLHDIVKQRRSQLDPSTIIVIEHNLKVIDDAIAQCKAALRNDPASRFLMESLNNALETKVELLRTAALLPARS